MYMVEFVTVGVTYVPRLVYGSREHLIPYLGAPVHILQGPASYSTPGVSILQGIGLDIRNKRF